MCPSVMEIEDTGNCCGHLEVCDFLHRFRTGNNSGDYGIIPNVFEGEEGSVLSAPIWNFLEL